MSSKKYRLAFITSRYAPNSAGGAEVHCQMMAEHVAALGHEVDVLTTCAKDHYTWKNHFPEEEKKINGVWIRRFKVNPRENVEYFHNLEARLSNRQPLSYEEELEWINGSVRCQGLEEYLLNNHEKYDYLLFIPYLFGTTYWGAKLFPEKTLHIPCLHDEPFAYLKIFKEMFQSAQGFIFNAIPEMEFAKKLYKLDDDKCFFVSLGFDREKVVGPELFRKRFKMNDPFILFAGRREKGKNVPLLVEYFRAYKKHHKNNLRLVLIGSGKVDLLPEDKENIFDYGYVTEDEKLSATEAALAFCQPSVNESLSIVVLQSWLVNVPALVHAQCSVTRDHCEKSNGGLYFNNYFEFEECMDYFISNPESTRQMGVNGCRYVEENFRWEVVLKRFEAALDKISQRSPLATNSKV